MNPNLIKASTRAKMFKNINATAPAIHPNGQRQSPCAAGCINKREDCAMNGCWWMRRINRGRDGDVGLESAVPSAKAGRVEMTAAYFAAMLWRGWLMAIEEE